MSDSLKEKTGSALFWNFIDKGGQQVIQLGFMCVLARLLLPDEFGLVGLLAVFTAVATLLQDSGFSSALIRKKDIDEVDYASVFYFNIAISITVYIVLFLCAPFIADYYEIPLLAPLARIIFISFVLNAFAIIQNVILIREIDFRTNTRITFIAGIISGAIAVLMAFKGYGVWSLAVQLVAQTFIRTLLLWMFVRWYPKEGFSFARLKEMTGYSMNLLVTALLNQVVANIYPLIIGKTDLMDKVGFYTQANKLTSILQSIIGNSIQGVAYPVLSKLEERERVKRVFRKIIRISSFIAFPAIILLAIGAEPIVLIILSEKWLPSVPILQILAIGASVYPLYHVTNSLAQSLGHSKLMLKVEGFRNILSIAILLVSVNYGIYAMVAGISTASIVAFVVNIYATGRKISYSLTEAIKDIVPYLFIACCIFSPLYFLNRIVDNIYLLLAIQVVVGMGGYLLIVKLLGSRVLADCIEFIKNKKLK
ncbi:lipopolysaccharide biosynthesis protein [Dysgonomonas sp. 216]|uniref:lipopolysaccharide biosynthesis protein n=1 Tax=Dysgonomonas sp. 216 TaxID=2302934 RepID=UPI0013D5628B|nr:lipopolysaccharide biosynthesis protein [Dysgonomonas sp. 216]NDW18398.1 lipopolysaccharide biosynthesis protein [Dysgonomonas sp. 216]